MRRRGVVLPALYVWCSAAADLRCAVRIPTSVFEVVSGLPRFGEGSAVKRVTWRGDDCYWAVERVRPSLVRGCGSLHTPCLSLNRPLLCLHRLPLSPPNTGRHPWPGVGHQGVGRRAGQARGDKGHSEGAVAAPHAAGERGAGSHGKGGDERQGWARQTRRGGWAGAVRRGGRASRCGAASTSDAPAAKTMVGQC